MPGSRILGSARARWPVHGEHPEPGQHFCGGPCNHALPALFIASEWRGTCDAQSLSARIGAPLLRRRSLRQGGHTRPCHVLISRPEPAPGRPAVGRASPVARTRRPGVPTDPGPSRNLQALQPAGMCTILVLPRVGPDKDFDTPIVPFRSILNCAAPASFTQRRNARANVATPCVSQTFQ